MEDKFIPYNDIFDRQDETPEKLGLKSDSHDPNIAQDLVTMLEITDVRNQMDNFVESWENRLDQLYEKLNYSYNKFGERNDYEYSQKRSRKILEGAKWKKEINLVQEKDKIDTLMNIKKKWLIVDSFTFIDEHDAPIKCLSVEIWDIDWGDGENEDPIVFVLPEFVLNAAWHVELPEDDDMSFEINIDQIKEIIVDETKYTFLL